MSERPERRNADRQIFRDLVGEMQALGDRVQKLVERMEEVALLAQQVENSKDEIMALRLNTESLRERVAHMEGRQPTVSVNVKPRDGFLIRPGQAAGIIGLVAAAITGILAIIEKALELARSIFIHK